MVNRIDPGLGVGAYKTYQVARPLPTHWAPATCEDVDCPNYLHGWKTAVDEATELGQRQAHYIRKESGRKFTAWVGPDGLTYFTFEAGQACFAVATHRAPVGRPELFVVRDGDWRGNPTGRRRVHTNVADWVDDFANHQATVAEQTQRG